MSLYDKMPCSGPSGCGHPRHRHTGTHVEGLKSACRSKLGNGRATCACTRFKEVQGASSVSKKPVEASRG